MMKKKLLLLFLLCLSSSVFAQTVDIKGSVSFDNENTDCVYNTLIYAIAHDTTLIAGNVFLTNQFDIQVPECEKYLVKLTSMGYQDIEFALERANASRLEAGARVFKTDTILLGEVVVMAKSPLVKIKGDRLTIHIKNTTLSDAGNILDMLKRTPGIILSGENNPIIPGRGEPLIIIDEKEIKSKDILQSIRSSDIESIEIDKSPSSAYAANVRAVIHIKTVKRMKDNLYLKVANTLSANRKLSTQPSLQFKLKKGIVSSMINYNYSDMNHVINENYYKYIYYPDYTFSSLSDAELKSKNQIHRILWGTDIDISSKNRLGIQYFYQNNKRDGHVYNTNKIIDRGTTTNRIIDQNNELSGKLHSISLDYTYLIDKNSSFSLVTDYASRISNGSELTNEENVEMAKPSLIQIANKSKYNVFTNSVKYKTILPFTIQSTVGYQYSNVHNPSNVHTSYSRSQVNETGEQTQLNDQIHAGFLNLAKTFDKFNWQLGIRYEYARNRIKTYSGNEAQPREEASDPVLVTRSYSDFFPSMEMGYQINDDWDVSLSASRYIDRPSFGELNPNVFYEDSLTYISGNPYVKPSYNQEVSLGANWKELSFSLTYAHIKNARTQTFVKEEGESNITRMIPINLSKAQTWNAGLMYSFTRNKISVFYSIGAELPVQEVPYLDKVKKVNKLSWNTSVNCEYAINEIFKLHGDFFYNSASESLLTYQYATNALNIGVTMALFKNKLIVDLYGTDLLRGMNFNNVYDQYLNIQSGTRGKGDFRGVRLSISYLLFNSNRITIKSQRGNNTILDRTN